MNRFSALFLLVALLVSLGMLNASAEVNKDALSQEFFRFCNDKVETTYEHDSVKIHDYVEANEMVFFYADCSWIFMHQMVIYPDSMGDWLFMTNPSENGISGLGVYVKSDNEIYTIEKAWEEGIVTDLSPVSELDGIVFYHIGDVNGDKVLNIKDATALQKFIANKKVDVVSNYDIREKVFNMNKDENINIKDATAIQKYLAKIEY